MRSLAAVLVVAGCVDVPPFAGVTGDASTGDGSRGDGSVASCPPTSFADSQRAVLAPLSSLAAVDEVAGRAIGIDADLEIVAINLTSTMRTLVKAGSYHGAVMSPVSQQLFVYDSAQGDQLFTGVLSGMTINAFVTDSGPANLGGFATHPMTAEIHAPVQVPGGRLQEFLRNADSWQISPDNEYTAKDFGLPSEPAEPALSDDGRVLTFVAENIVYATTREQFATTSRFAPALIELLAGTRGAELHTPRLSPDCKRLYVVEAGNLVRYSK